MSFTRRTYFSGTPCSLKHLQTSCIFIELTKFITNRRQQAEQPPPSPISRLVRRLKTFRSANYYMYPVIKYHVSNYKNACIKSIRRLHVYNNMWGPSGCHLCLSGLVMWGPHGQPRSTPLCTYGARLAHMGPSRDLHRSDLAGPIWAMWFKWASDIWDPCGQPQIYPMWASGIWDPCGQPQIYPI